MCIFYQSPFVLALLPVTKLQKICIPGIIQGILICHVVQSLEHCSHNKRLEHSGSEVVPEKK